MNQDFLRKLADQISSLNDWKNSFGEWETDPTLSVSEEKIRSVLTDLSSRLEGNYPFHHPAYAGQMLKPPHALAWTAYSLAMSINPNNHALDGGPPSSEMEKEVLAEMARFVGYGDEYLGHLTGSGTIANLESLWVSRESHPGKKIAFTSNSHYTHERMCGVLGVETKKIELNADGSFDADNTDGSDIGTLVVTLGTTGLGDVEPLYEILPWAKENGIRIHIDAAYGGFFRTLKDSDLIDGRSWKLMGEADSIVIDPHKHGLQPYGCGCVLFKEPAVGRFYKHDSPYTYFTSDDLHLGEISLECSRAGAAAVGFWATLQAFPLEEKKGFGPIMAKCRKAALNAYEILKESTVLQAYKKPELDIIGYFPVPEEKTLSEVSRMSKKVFDTGMRDRSFYLSLYRIEASEFCRLHPDYEADEKFVTILRSVLMKPEQADFVQELFKRIEEVVN